MTKIDEAPLPAGWGVDELTKFIDRARNNQLATFSQNNIHYGRLSEIDGCFNLVAKNIVEPKDPITPTMFYRCHSAYRAACITGMAGQVPETFALLRTCLKCWVWFCDD